MKQAHEESFTHESMSALLYGYIRNDSKGFAKFIRTFVPYNHSYFAQLRTEIKQ